MRDSDEALQAYLDGQLALEDAASLETRLKAEPELAAALLTLAREEAVIREWARSQITPAVPAQQPQTPRRTRYWAWGAAAALVMLGFFAGVRYVMRSPSSGGVADVTGPNHPSAPTLLEPTQMEAVLQSVSGDVAVNGATTTGVTRLKPGDVVKVAEQGEAQVRLGDGSTLSLQGTDLPATFTVSNMDARTGGTLGTLSAGRLRLDLRAQLRPRFFSIRTPHGTATAQNTRCVLSADVRQTNLNVADGQVQFGRIDGGDPINVSNAHFAVAAKDLPLLSKPTRETDGLQALYTFAGHGTSVPEASGHGDLEIVQPKNVRWRPEGGLEITGPTLLTSSDAGHRIAAACQQTHELTLETWFQPAAEATTSYTARLISLSQGRVRRNFTLRQGDVAGRYCVHLRTTASAPNAPESLNSPIRSAGPRLTHLVFTRAKDGTWILYLDGKAAAWSQQSGGFETWDRDAVLELANSSTNDRTWLGVFYLVAVYNRALPATTVENHYLAGPAVSADKP